MRTIIREPQTGFSQEFDVDQVGMRPNGAYAFFKDGQVIAMVPATWLFWHPDGPTKVIEAQVLI